MQNTHAVLDSTGGPVPGGTPISVTTIVCQLARLSPNHTLAGWHHSSSGTCLPHNFYTETYTCMVWHGEAWCGADKAKKQTSHLKTGPPLSGQ